MSAVEDWLKLCDPARSRLDRQEVDPVASGLEAPSWYSGEVGDPFRGDEPDPGYVMSVQEDPQDRSWSSSPATVPLTRYRGEIVGDQVELAHATVDLFQSMDERIPSVHLRWYWRAYDDQQRRFVPRYAGPLRMRLQEAEAVAEVLLAAVRMARAED